MRIQEAYKKIAESPELKKAALDALKAGKGDEFLKENGFDLTIDQIKDYVVKIKNGQLSKEELNTAAGGGGCMKSDCFSIFYSVTTIGIGCAVSGMVNGEIDCGIYDHLY